MMNVLRPHNTCKKILTSHFRLFLSFFVQTCRKKFDPVGGRRGMPKSNRRKLQPPSFLGRAFNSPSLAASLLLLLLVFTGDSGGGGASRSFVSYHLPSSSPSSSLSYFDPPDPFTTLGEVIYVVFLHAKLTLRYCSTFNIVPENASTYLPLFLLCGPSLEQRRTEQKPFFSF